MKKKLKFYMRVDSASCNFTRFQSLHSARLYQSVAIVLVHYFSVSTLLVFTDRCVWTSRFLSPSVDTGASPWRHFHGLSQHMYGKGGRPYGCHDGGSGCKDRNLLTTNSGMGGLLRRQPTGLVVPSDPMASTEHAPLATDEQSSMVEVPMGCVADLPEDNKYHHETPPEYSHPSKNCARRFVLYTCHALYVLVVLLGWALWRPLVVTLPITGIAYEVMNGCPLVRFEMWLMNEPVTGQPGWRGRVLLWADLLIYIVTGWVLG